MAKPNRNKPSPQKQFTEKESTVSDTIDQNAETSTAPENDQPDVAAVAAASESTEVTSPETDEASKLIEGSAITATETIDDQGTSDQAEQPEQPVLEVKPEPTPEPQVPVVQAVVIQDTSASTEELSEAQAYLNGIREKGTDAQKRILTAIEAFCDRTRPRMPIKEGDGFKAQNDLLNHMLWALDQEPSEFDKAWSTLLIYFLEHHDFAGGRNSPSGYTALSEYRATAFREEWTDHDRLTAYTNLITVLRTTRNPKTRKHDIKTVVLDKVSPEVINGKRLENLQRFYGV